MKRLSLLLVMISMVCFAWATIDDIMNFSPLQEHTHRLPELMLEFHLTMYYRILFQLDSPLVMEIFLIAK